MGQPKSQILQSSHCRMHTLRFSGRPRIKNKYFISHRLNDPVDGMVEEAVHYRSFMDMTAFRIVDEKREVAAMFVGLMFKIFMQRKNMVFKIDLEFSYIAFVAFLLLELRPSVEQVL